MNDEKLLKKGEGDSMVAAKEERREKCYNCRYFKTLNTEVYKCQGTCCHPEYIEDGYLLDIKNFMDSCEFFRARCRKEGIR